MAAITAGAPLITDRLCEACARTSTALQAHLDALGVPYRVEPRLVRGLDYYTRTAFEFYVQGRAGQQSALGGGGPLRRPGRAARRQPTPGIGFGLGLDRVAPRPGGAGARRAALDGPLAVVVGADPADTAGPPEVATASGRRGCGLRADLGRRKLGGAARGRGRGCARTSR